MPFGQKFSDSLPDTLFSIEEFPFFAARYFFSGAKFNLFLIETESDKSDELFDERKYLNMERFFGHGHG